MNQDNTEDESEMEALLDSPSFSAGFRVPFACHAGIVHHVYSVRQGGQSYGGIRNDDGSWQDGVKINTLYTVDVELEKPINENDAEASEFILDPVGYLESHPWVRTHQVRQRIALEDDTLIRQDLDIHG